MYRCMCVILNNNNNIISYIFRLAGIHHITNRIHNCIAFVESALITGTKPSWK